MRVRDIANKKVVQIDKLIDRKIERERERKTWKEWVCLCENNGIIYCISSNIIYVRKVLFFLNCKYFSRSGYENIYLIF